MTTTNSGGGRRAGLLIRAARVNEDLIDAEIREYRRREDELRQQKLIAAAAARVSTSSNSVVPMEEPETLKNTVASTTPADVRQSRSLERRRAPASEVMMRRWASLRLHRELLYERQRELELLQQGRIDTTSDQRRITLT